MGVVHPAAVNDLVKGRIVSCAPQGMKRVVIPVYLLVFPPSRPSAIIIVAVALLAHHVLVIQVIHCMNIETLDLNLLVIFRAIYAERNISRAAVALGKSQPAVSNALSRLRVLCNDQLFVPVSGGVRPTKYAETLAPVVQQALSLLEGALKDDPNFAPALARRTFYINMSDYIQAILLPRLMEWLKEFAPAIRITVMGLNPQELPTVWAEGAIDLVIECHEITGNQITGNHLYQQKLFEDEFVCLVRQDHPHIGETMTRDQFLELRHAAVRQRGQPNLIDTSLAQQGLERRSVLDIPHCMAAPFIISRTDLIAVLPRRQAMDCSTGLPVRILPCPIPLPRFATHQYWLTDVNQEKPHQWLRQAIREFCKGF
jgi:DNA-binding transcriptional LysR family regulator